MIQLTKEEFIKYLNFIYIQEEKQEQFTQALENLCPGNYCDCWLYNDYAEKYVELLKKLMNDTCDDIRYFLYDMERGKSKSEFYKNIPYHSEEELYDYLLKEDKKEHEKITEALENIKTAPSFMGGNPRYTWYTQSSELYLSDIKIIEDALKGVAD